jgi:glycosyltransferase involved in cell wall biosynthesis
MATFNGAAHLGEQLADLAAQSVLPAELVVCDDGSTDDTLAILERFAIGGPFPVRIHRNPEQLGYRANFLKCASLCQSDLIAFCDQDDRWAPEKIQRMVTCFEDPEVLLAFHDAEIITEDERPVGKLVRPRPIGASPRFSGSPWRFALGFTQVFRRWLCDCDGWWELSEDPQSERGHMAHDQWYFFLASALGTIINVEQPLVRYRQHDTNVFGWSRRPLWSRLAAKVRSATWRYERRLQSARQSAIILDQAASKLRAPYNDWARKGADEYRRLANLCGARAAIYAAPSIIHRARSLVTLVRGHAYGADEGHLGAAALVMDMAVGLTGLGRKRALRTSKR